MGVPRRKLIGAAAASAGLVLSGCDRLNENSAFRSVLRSAEDANRAAHRLLVDRSALAREFTQGDLSPEFRMNGTINPSSQSYQTHAAEKFVNWRLQVNGLVQRPMSLSLAQLTSMPAREQITRHDCVEGWSAIGKWRGPPLSLLLKSAGLLPAARFIVFHCADDFDGTPYYESIDLIDAFHPQTILAWSMNGAQLPVGHGAPLRLRAERQLGYKHAKYIMRIEAAESLSDIGGGKGGYWEDVADYEWYAGI